MSDPELPQQVDAALRCGCCWDRRAIDRPGLQPRCQTCLDECTNEMCVASWERDPVVEVRRNERGS